MKYNDPNNEVMDGWPTIVMWILIIIIICVIINNS